MRSRGGADSRPADENSVSIAKALFTMACILVLLLGGLPALPEATARAQEPEAAGSLQEVGKRINELIYPTFGCPAIHTRGSELTIE